MTQPLVDPNDPIERQRDKLWKIAQSLMARVEQAGDYRGAGYAHFQRAVLLEEQVRARTRDLEKTLDLLNESNLRLAQANREAERARSDLANAIETVQEGFALFDPEERLVMFNSRFARHLPDVRRALKPGLTFGDYVTRASRSEHMFLPRGETPEQWVDRRLARHRDDHVVFNVALVGDRWLQVSEQRTMDGGTVILQTDVTDMIRLERKERERMLDDQARIIRATLDHIDQGVAIFDADRRLVGWNQRLGALLALPANQLVLGMRFARLDELMTDRIATGDPARQSQLGTWVASDGPRPALRFEMERGREMWLDVYAQETPDRGFVMSFTDVTAERNAIRAMYEANESLEQRVTERTLALEDALAEAERANASKSRFVAAASHDLLQPLSAAKLFLSSVEDSPELTAITTDTLKRARNALGSVESILGALLDISKLDAGLAALEVGPVPLDIALQTLADEFAPIAARKGLRLRILPATVTVRSDASYLRRILQNLIANAIRYTESGRVLVGARRLKGAVRVEVWDTGPGIPEDQQANIFKEFQRLNRSASPSDGMGLGLAIVDRACALLGHPIELQSEVGRGSCFMVTLPLSGAAPTPVRAQAYRSEHAANALAGAIVLLIENDAEVRLAMIRQLERWGLSVLDTGSGAEALALLEEIGIAPDIIAADYHLDNDETGLDALTAIFRLYGRIPSMIVTANRSPDLRRQCQQAGIRILEKPIDPDALLGELGDMMRSGPRWG
jgi:signal transduction histidine kinase